MVFLLDNKLGFSVESTPWDNTIVFEPVYPGVHVIGAAVSNGVRETLTVTDPSIVASEFKPLDCPIRDPEIFVTPSHTFRKGVTDAFTMSNFLSHLLS